MEKLNVTKARELCQLHGIDIYPVDVEWSTKIAIKQGDLEKMGTQNYLQQTVKINRKWAIGWEEKIDQMWLHKAAQIRKHLKNKANGGYSAQAAALFPLMAPDSLTVGFALALASAFILALIVWLIINNKKR